MTISAQRVGMLVWLLIYSGLFAVAIGVALDRAGESYGWIVIAVGAVDVAAGCVLLWVRSRMAQP